MKKTVRNAFAGSVFAVSAIASGAAFAAPNSPANVSRGQAVPPPISGDKLLSSLFYNGDPGSALSAGFNVIDTQTLVCNKASCTITVGNMVQLDTPDGFWAICPAVDGNYTSPPCPYQGLIPSGGSAYVTGNSRASIQVSRGSHTVTTSVYVDQSGTLASFEDDYAVYAP